MKGKFDADSLKELCINHFEKVLFGILVVFFLMMIRSALQVKPYTKKPDQLSSACSQARAKLEAVQEVEPVTRSYDTLVVGIQEEIPASEYVTSASWNPILSKEGQKRKSPRALAVTNLNVVEWHGSVQRPQRMDETGAENAFDDGLGGRRLSQTEGVRCCILIGEIPMAEQELEYQRKLGLRDLSNFKGAGAGRMDTMEDPADSPMFYNYAVQRAEVPADGDISKLTDNDWEDLRRKVRGKPSINEQRILYFQGEGELGSRGGSMDLPEKYAPPQLWRVAKTAEDLKAQKEGKNQDSKTAKGRNARGANPAMANPDGMTVNGMTQARNESLMIPLPQVSNSGSNMQFDWVTYLPYPEEFELELTSMDGRGLRRPANADADAENEGSEDAEDEEFEDAEEEDYAGNNDDEYELVEDQNVNDNMDQEAKVRLFRYVDYTVEPGKQYVYRVKVQLHNPNYQYDPPFNVENPDDRKVKYLESAWSNVTPPVTIPLDQHFYLPGYAKKFTTDIKEKRWSPYLTLMPVTFNETDGNEDFTYFSEIMNLESKKSSRNSRRKPKKEEPVRIYPGQVLNLMVYEDSIRQLGNMDQGMNPQRRYDDDEEEDRPRKSFRTGFILLDARGGKELYAPLDKRDFEGAAQEIKSHPEGIYSPSMVLLMGPKGDFVIQSELEDVSDVYRRRDKSQQQNLELESMMQQNGMENQEEDRRSRRSSSRRNRMNEGGDMGGTQNNRTNRLR